ncbi:HlyD family secretion protein [bacterium]|nr:HlyD family secretion protein [bacterium]
MENNIEEQKEVKNTNNKLKIKKPFIIFGACILVIIAAFFIYENSKYQSTDDAYIETTTITVSPKVSGELVDVFVEDNQKVKAGDVVAQIDKIDYQIKVKQAKALYQKELLKQTNARASLNAANSEIELARKDLERYKNLYEAGAVSKQMLDAAQTKYETVKSHQIKAEQDLFSESKTNVADANLESLLAQKEAAEQALAYTTIYAPQDGTVANRRAEKGMLVQPGTPLFVLVPEKMWIVANFKETQIERMRPGMEVKIKIDTYPNKVFKGKIDSIQRTSGAKSSLFPPENAVGSFVKIVQRIPVKIVFDEEIDPEQYPIAAGMSVIPRIKVK